MRHHTTQHHTTPHHTTHGQEYFLSSPFSSSLSFSSPLFFLFSLSSSLSFLSSPLSSPLLSPPLRCPPVLSPFSPPRVQIKYHLISCKRIPLFHYCNKEVSLFGTLPSGLNTSTPLPPFPFFFLLSFLPFFLPSFLPSFLPFFFFFFSPSLPHLTLLLLS